jgi:hypothetical protein
VLRLVQIPQHGGSVLATRGAERSVGRDGNSVDVASVSDVVGLQSARRELPDLFGHSQMNSFVKLLSKLRRAKLVSVHWCWFVS